MVKCIFLCFDVLTSKKGIPNPEAIDRVGAALASLNVFALPLALRYLTQEFQQTHRW